MFLAKSMGKESIEEHTDRLLQLFDAFLALYGDRFKPRDIALIKQAIIYHDLGKMNSAFQSYLYKKLGKKVPAIFANIEPYKMLEGRDIPHGILSGAFIRPKRLREKEGFDDEDITVLVTAVCNHHTRSIDCVEKINTIETIIHEDLQRLAEIYGKDFCKVNAIRKYNKLGVNNKYQEFSNSLWIRFALVKGILNKMDYAASARCRTTEYKPDNAKERVLKEFDLRKYSLRSCQEYLLDKGQDNVIITASTGMGKTEAALIWAGSDKTFYTLPYRVSINAIFQRLQDSNYYNKDKLVLLHSDAFNLLVEYEQEMLKENYSLEEAKSKYEQVRNFSYPFTICTVDQLFLFALRPLGSELAPATLSYAKIIIDEIQAYEPRLLAKILFGLYLINKLGGRFLIMTATLPPFIENFFLQKEINYLTAPPFFSKEIRHIVCIDGEEFNYDLIKKEAQNKKVLLICNTIDKAKEIFDKLGKEVKNINLLHSRFILKDRKIKEKEILDFAINTNVKVDKNFEKNVRKNTGIWITTQLVEASLDIDFDLLFTEMSTADSLLQRMGRCYRSRVYTNKTPNIFVYDTKNGIGGKVGIYDKDIYQRSVSFLMQYQNQPFYEEDKQQYIEQVYDIKEIKTTNYYKLFSEELEDLENLKNGFLKKKDAQKEFRNINAIEIIPYEFVKQANVFEDELLTLIKENRKQYAQEINDLKKSIRDLTLSVNPRNIRKFKITMNQKVFGYPICNNNYDSQRGLINYEDTERFL